MRSQFAGQVNTSAGGVVVAHIMNLFPKEKLNPLIGAAGVSAVPMAARVAQKVGQADNPAFSCAFLIILKVTSGRIANKRPSKSVKL